MPVVPVGSAPSFQAISPACPLYKGVLAFLGSKTVKKLRFLVSVFSVSLAENEDQLAQNSKLGNNSRVDNS